MSLFFVTRWCSLFIKKSGPSQYLNSKIPKFGFQIHKSRDPKIVGTYFQFFEYKSLITLNEHNMSWQISIITIGIYEPKFLYPKNWLVKCKEKNYLKISNSLPRTNCIRNYTLTLAIIIGDYRKWNNNKISLLLLLIHLLKRFAFDLQKLLLV